MSNDLTIPPLPAYLQQFAQAPAAAAASFIGGISSGSFSRISLRGSRFHFQEANGEELHHQQLYLDVFIVDANPAVSKNFYRDTYNPQVTDAAAPDCFSDNGIAPSPRAAQPQCQSCALCPHNAWGSKVTPSGGKTKACADSKRIAVILAHNPSGPIYELRIPAASMSGYAAALRQFIDKGVPPSMVVWRLTFDPQEDYPKLVFQAIGYLPQEYVNVVTKATGSAEAKRVTGQEGGTPALAAPAPQPALAPPPGHVVVPSGFQPPPPAFAPAAPASVPSTPAAPSQVAPAANGFAAPAFPSDVPMNPAPEQKRRRRTKAEIAAANGQAAAPPPAQGFAPPTNNLGSAGFSTGTPTPTPTPGYKAFSQPEAQPPQGQPVAGVVINPTPASPELDNLLAGAFKL